MDDIPFTPPAASEAAAGTDAIYLGLVVASCLVLLLVFGLILYFSVRYREGSTAPRRRLPALLSRNIEFGWTLATLLGFLFIFAWAAAQNFTMLKAQPGEMTIQVLGKQWMWKIEHRNGAREINALHVPVNTWVRLVLNSQDVIHDFYIPALRLKHDVVPGLTRSISFSANRVGQFPIECAEYCGTDHSRMLATLYVMPADAFARWLSAQPQADNLATLGFDKFRAYGCSGCHLGNGPVRAPSLAGLYGSNVPLATGRVIRADEAYIRDSILQPRKQIVAGYAPVMPSFAGRMPEGDLVAIVAYIRSLADESRGHQGEPR